MANFKDFNPLNSFQKLFKTDDLNIPNTQNATTDTSYSHTENGKFYDDYEDFTEFEDETGKIMLIKYSGKYEFRGNDYCIYTLCNEKTGSHIEGIAQIKGGQYIKLTDPERIAKIKAFITDKQNAMIEMLKHHSVLDYVAHKIYCGDLYGLVRAEDKYHIFDSAHGKFWHEDEPEFKKLAKKLFNM